MGKALLAVLAIMLAGLAATADSGHPPELRDQAVAGPGPRPCGKGADGFEGPSSDLYCVELIPAPGLSGLSAQLELGWAGGPFSATVTPEGRQVYDPVLEMSGLPDPATLGEYGVYVAWAIDPTFDPVINLGVVQNGSNALPPIDLNKFTVVISAEREEGGLEREGRMVLRAQSPSMRMRPADVTEFALGLGSGTMSPQATGWSVPPAPDNLTMLPVMMELRPDATPYLPEPSEGSVPPHTRAMTRVELSDGDTLDLTAGVVRHTLDGREHVMFAYNGQIPGPMLSVPQGGTLTVRFRNETEWPTTVHWHGLRIDNASDGVPGLTQDAVEPDGSFTYTLTFPDPGIYWYHPHLREDVLQELGLYGTIMVRPAADDYWGSAHSESTLVLDDILIGDDGLMPLGRERATHVFMGRFGNTLLVNGDVGEQREARVGEVVRYVVANVSNTRTFNLSFGGAPIKVLGSDIGAFEQEVRVESVVIGPAERYVLNVRFDHEGDVAITNRVQGIDHLYGSFFQEVDTIASVSVRGVVASRAATLAFDTLRSNPAAVRDLAPYRRGLDRPVDHRLVLEMTTEGLTGAARRLMVLDSVYFHPVEWSGTMPRMNWASTPEQVHWTLRDPVSGRTNMDIGWSFDVGDVVRIRLVNRRDVLHGMQHPIHLHGQRFLVVAVNGRANENLGWKDTVLVPAGSTVDILLEITNRGQWMTHCHISEHLESGMMTAFTVR